MIENCEKIAEQLYPERPINLPEGQAVVVPVPERRAFIAGAAWQAVGVTSPPQPPSGRTGFEPPHGGFVTAYEDVETRARELAGSWAVTPPESKAFTDCADAIAALRRELDEWQRRAIAADLLAGTCAGAEIALEEARVEVERLTRERDSYKAASDEIARWMKGSGDGRAT